MPIQKAKMSQRSHTVLQSTRFLNESRFSHCMNLMALNSKYFFLCHIYTTFFKDEFHFIYFVYVVKGSSSSFTNLEQVEICWDALILCNNLFIGGLSASGFLKF